MKKEELIIHYEKECDKYVTLEQNEFETIIRHLRDLANDMENNGYLNEYKLEKLNHRIEEYNNWKRLSNENISILNTLKMVD